MLIEFAFVVLIFLAFLFFVIDMARLMFVTNTLQEATRRAASFSSVSNPGSASGYNDIRNKAIFRTSPGGLMLMPELTDQSVRIDYLAVVRDSSGAYSTQEVPGGLIPSDLAQNRHNCVVDAYAPNCIRFVRVRICNPQSSATCEPMKFKPLLNFFNFEIALPIATTISKAQSFGYSPN
ncbi:MAG: pilus assembly protein TadE [Massilia sp.]|nr:pilus assembly protein TadE [Massilia sp.]